MGGFVFYCSIIIDSNPHSTIDNKISVHNSDIHVCVKLFFDYLSEKGSHFSISALIVMILGPHPPKIS